MEWLYRAFVFILDFDTPTHMAFQLFDIFDCNESVGSDNDDSSSPCTLSTSTHGPYGFYNPGEMFCGSDTDI